MGKAAAAHPLPGMPCGGGHSPAVKHQTSASAAGGEGPGNFRNQPWEEGSCRDPGPCRRKKDLPCDEEAIKQRASFCVSECKLDPRGYVNKALMGPRCMAAWVRYGDEQDGTFGSSLLSRGQSQTVGRPRGQVCPPRMYSAS